MTPVGMKAAMMSRSARRLCRNVLQYRMATARILWSSNSHLLGLGREGGPPDEVIALLRQGLADAKRTTQSSEIYGEFLAIDTAMDKLKAGELCLILVDQVEEALAHLAKRVAEPQA